MKALTSSDMLQTDHKSLLNNVCIEMETLSSVHQSISVHNCATYPMLLFKSLF